MTQILPNNFPGTLFCKYRLLKIWTVKHVIHQKEKSYLVLVSIMHRKAYDTVIIWITSVSAFMGHRKMDTSFALHQNVPVLLKGTTRGLSGVFLPLVMNPLCLLKYYDRSITNPWSLPGVVSLVHLCLPYMFMGYWFAIANIGANKGRILQVAP